MRAGRREWIGLGILALPCLLYSMDLTVLYMAVPKLSADLHPSSVQLLWITDIYGFMLAGLLLTMGSVGDRIGRRRLLLIGAAAFGAASLLAAFSPSAPMLIVARALLGVAGATLAPSTLSLLHGMFADERQRTFAVGVWIASFSAGAVFVRRQQLVSDPLVDVGLFRSAAFSSAIGAMVAAVFVVDGTFLFLSQYLQLISGKTPLIAAVWLLPATGGLVVGSMLAPLITPRVGPVHLLVGGLVAAAIGVALLTRIDLHHGLLALVAGSLVMGVGSGFVGTVATDVVVGAAPGDRSGAASAISETGAELGGALGIAVLGSVGLAVYRTRLDGTLPSTLTPAQQQAATSTLADATHTSAQLTQPASGELFHASAVAFTDSLHFVAASAAVITLLLALLAGVVLRRMGPAADAA